MIEVKQHEVAICDRCAFGTEKKADDERVYALEDRYYRLDLCPKHRDQFDREMSVWTRLSAEIDSPYANVESRPRRSTFFNPEDQLQDARRLRELRERKEQREIEAARLKAAEREAQRKLSEEHARRAIPGAMKWTLSLHAYQRLVQRGVSIYEVLETAANPEQTYYQPWRGDLIAIYQRENCRLVINEGDHTVVTVIDREKELEADPRAHAHHQERKAQ